ncbi:BTB/POZ protein [Phlyctochytrium arcticum]|nr:BTB/POZ protein [Phlyctochytrium arcticum]
MRSKGKRAASTITGTSTTSAIEDQVSAREPHSVSEVLTLNVGGSLFQTFRSTIERFPRSLLAKLIEHDRYSYALNPRDGSRMFFVDRDPRFFHIILDFYRMDLKTEHLLFYPHNLVVSGLRQDLEYFGLLQEVVVEDIVEDARLRGYNIV